MVKYSNTKWEGTINTCVKYNEGILIKRKKLRSKGIFSRAIFMDSRKAGHDGQFDLGGTPLMNVTRYKYVGHIISNDLSDDADIQAKVRLRNSKKNTFSR